jgi:hypothetical protein
MAIDGVKVAGLELKVYFLGPISSRCAPFAPLPRLDQRVKQHQLTVFPRSEVMGCSFGNMANGSRTELDAPPLDPQTPTAPEHLADHVLVVVVDLLAVGVSDR